jgi:hypothetical protein
MPRSRKRKNRRISKFETESISKSEKKRPSPDINPCLYYKKCRDCGNTELVGTGKKGSCTKCQWYFFVHSVEELQESHPWPSPILLGDERGNPVWCFL